ncbi:sensor histidine kinase [Herbidospora sp. NEAU-GS84]|uniref:histidine kinase n=1 Tax=Herbidospora solisilvae TaxID=2696284 RepID=A0A7C9N1F9_9ACTN|nr:sensor histidine kinase [Herbidospora solisilvae]NAS22949.1 sensor histidine kinase [Herbidospora solisilvae]
MVRRTVTATGRLLLGLLLVPLCLLAIAVTVFTLVVSATYLGLLLLPYAIRLNRGVASLARRNAGAWLGRPVTASYHPIRGGVLTRVRVVMGDPQTWRDLAFLAQHVVTGPFGAIPAIAFWGALGWALSLPLWWDALGPGHRIYLPWALDSWATVAVTVPLFMALVAAVGFRVVPLVAEGLAQLARSLLATPQHVRLAERVAEALDAHGYELRRIERDLHDGAQARLVSIAMRLGIAERVLATDPGKAAALITEARLSTEETMTELRGIIRGMYPPILADRGLPGAVEAAAYFVIAEALTNVARHSSAGKARVSVRRTENRLTAEVTDDGRGGADENGGSGLAGIRRRVSAFDGVTTLTSPPGGPTTLRVELPCE